MKNFPTTRRERTEFLEKNRKVRTEREKTISELLAQGSSNEEVAQASGMSLRTIQRRRNKR